MSVRPAPENGGVVLGRDRPGRALRVSSHPELGRVVLSLWDGARCIGTLRVAPSDVPDMVRALTGAAVAAAGSDFVPDEAEPGPGTHLTAVPFPRPAAARPRRSNRLPDSASPTPAVRPAGRMAAWPPSACSAPAR